MTGSFAARYPRVWHVIEPEGAECRTLYPAATLRTLCGLDRDDSNRATFQRLRLPDGSLAVMRPQLMRDERLLPTLAGGYIGRPGQWRHHINQHVFFWVRPDRRDRFATACVRMRARGASDPLSKVVIVEIETALLLARHAAEAFWSRINCGSTARAGARVRRDQFTLRPIDSWSGEPAAELAIRGPVPLAPVAARLLPSDQSS
jgi:hypothetical protein